MANLAKHIENVRAFGIQPVVAINTRPDDELEQIAEQAGADGFLSKSHGIEKLGDMVDEMVDAILW